MNLNLLAQQVQPVPALSNGRPFAFAELGCGHGLTATMIAAAYPQAQVYATDFNPAHIVGATRLAEKAGLKNIHLYEHSFAEFLNSDLPDFDVVSLHGVYSWISDENRKLIRDFLYAKLKPGGLCYISYNTLPGWSTAAPMRKLMIEMGAGEMGKSMPGRIDSALDFLGKLKDANAGFFRSNPAAAARLEGMGKHSRNYLAHEYMNRDWTLFYHCDVARELAEAKLVFAASAHPGDHVDVVNLTPDQQLLVAGVTDPGLRETVRDFCVSQQFRRDIFVKGLLRLAAQEQAAALSSMRFALTVPRAALGLKATFPVGEVNLQPEVYEPVADALKDKPKSVAELLAAEPLQSLGYQKVQQALLILTSTGQISPVQEDKQMREAKPGCDRLNLAIMEYARYSSDITYLVSPLTGSGVPVDRFVQLMLLARRQNQKDMAGFVWSVLASQGQRIVKDGKALETPEDNMSELRLREQEFIEKSLPLLTYLGIA
ncbi:MAG: class I SAM-dependent methyltransferase [Alphaproteobacteria bacterium]|nr:class I SAM-dependent methyltransferase [Alphaproteobacteria bacterium]